MKSIYSFALISFTMVSMVGSADSPYYGPYIQKTVGDSKKGNYVLCRVIPGNTKISHVVDGKKEKDPASHKNELKKADMEGLISLASKGRLNKSLHFVETVPNVDFSAGIAPDLDSFILRYDGSDTKVRVGKEAALLVKQAQRTCGKLKPKGEAREEGEYEEETESDK